MTNYLLAKCTYCDETIRLDQKTLRHQNKWFHASCFQLTLNKIPQKQSPHTAKSTQTVRKSDPVLKTRVLSEEVYAKPKPVKKQTFVPQQIQISSASVRLLEKDRQIKKPKDEPKPVKQIDKA
jgi:hypothetical protein